MKRRRGVTLIEVLLAIFIMALGLLALLTLFPLGALSMAQALKDDRVAQTSANALPALRVLGALQDQGIVNAMTNNNQIPADQPSLPVYFDPIGVLKYPGNSSNFIGGTINRKSCTFLTSSQSPSQLTAAWFTSLDDMVFTNDGPAMGVPANDQGQPASAGGAVQRVGAYSWAAMLRRPAAGYSPTEVYIVVYSGRSTDLTTGFAPAGETTIPPQQNPPPGVPLLVGTPLSAGTTVLTVDFTSVPSGMPDIRAGSWILDSSFGAAGHGDFYRVTGVTMNGTTADLELQTPLKVGGVTQIVLMDNVAEVIYKGIISP